MKKGNKMKKGFTLIELITVVIIIAIMAALALPQYTRFIERGQASTAKNALNMVRKGEAMYFTLESQYTNSMTDLAREVPEILRLSTSNEWSYAITLGTDNVTFTATATRLKGSYGTSYITITDEGNLSITTGSKQNPTTIW